MRQTRPAGYSTLQIVLHWSVATLVACQFFINDEIDEAWRGLVAGRPVAADEMASANVHVVIGLIVLVLALLRIAIRLMRGAPPPAPNEPRLLQIAGTAAHVGLYVLLVLTPLSGAAAWFLQAEPAASAHGAFRVLLFFLVVAHIAGALAHLVIFRSDVFWRILAPRD